jgi:hypothetical protein
VLHEQALAHLDETAILDPGQGVTLTYAQFLAAVERQAALLAKTGIGAGDLVVIAIPRSAAEIVAVAAVLRLAAAFTALPPDSPPTRLSAMLRLSRPRGPRRRRRRGETDRARRAAVRRGRPDRPARVGRRRTGSARAAGRPGTDRLPRVHLRLDR